MFSQQIREIQTLTEEQISPQVVEVLKTAVSKLQCFDPQSDPEILVRQFRRLIIDSDLQHRMAEAFNGETLALVDYRSPLSEMFKWLEIPQVDERINDDNFPLAADIQALSLPEPKHYFIRLAKIRIQFSSGSDEANTKSTKIILEQLGYRPATLRELLAWSCNHRDEPVFMLAPGASLMIAGKEQIVGFYGGDDARLREANRAIVGLAEQDQHPKEHRTVFPENTRHLFLTPTGIHGMNKDVSILAVPLNCRPQKN